MLARDWRRHLSRDQAVEIGIEGLKRAIELHDQRKARFRVYAKVAIARTISREVKKRRRLVSLDKPRGEDDRTLYDVIERPTTGQEERENQRSYWKTFCTVWKR